MFYFLRYGNKTFFTFMNTRKAPIVPIRFHSPLPSGTMSLRNCIRIHPSSCVYKVRFDHDIRYTNLSWSREFGRFTGHLLSCVRLGEGLVFKLLVELSVHPFGASVDQNSKVQHTGFVFWIYQYWDTFFLSLSVLMCSFEQFYLIFIE